MKIRHLIFTCAALAMLPLTVQAADENSGFGAPFANAGHAGFSNPGSDGELINGRNLQDIEPAGGDDLDIANDNDETQMEALRDIINNAETLMQDTDTIGDN